MNILYLNNSVHLGGDTICILNLCKEFKKGNNIIMVSSGGVYETEFEKLGIKHYMINNVENKSIINIIANCIKLRKLIKMHKIDVIHSHHRMTTLIAKFASLFTNVKLIHTQHTCICDKFILTNLALRNIEVIAVSNEVKKILVQKSKLAKSRIHIIYNSITLDKNNQDNEVDIKLINMKQEGFFIVCQVSRIVEDKGVYDFVEIAKRTIRENDRLRFVLIGDGPEREKLQRYIVAEGLCNYILLLGSKKNIIQHLKYIDLLILCSYVEGLPLTPIEAFSQNIPVIGSDIGGTNEVILNGENGYLVTPKNIDGFKEKILFLFKNSEILKCMGRKAYLRYKDEFNETKYVLEHNKIYLN